MAETLDQRLEIEGDDRFVLDDENGRGDLSRHFATRLLDQVRNLGWGNIEDLRRLFGREPLDRRQQERLPGERRYLLDPAFGEGRPGRYRTKPLIGMEFQIFENIR